MPGGQKIHLYCLCWNDARMLPYFFRHYDDMVDKYYVFDNGSTDGSLSLLENHPRVEITHFDVPGNSFVEEERRLGDTMWRGSDADWVIITDIDEHIHHPTLAEYLRRCQEQNITAIRSVGFEMISDRFPRASRRLIELVTLGQRSSGHDRLCIFNPRALTATNFSPGRHEAYPEGRVFWPAWPQVLLLHYKQLGVDYPIKRSAELRKGLRAGDLNASWGVHYTWSTDEIVANWRQLKASAGPVPGLGTLRDMEPAKYFEDERVLAESGLVDREWYLVAYPDIEEAGADAVSHFCVHGWKEGRKPNFYFDPEWYCANYPELSMKWRNPLYDYVLRGEIEDASPSPLFDTRWYRGQHRLSIEESPLRHYLERRKAGLVSPLPEFDSAAYCRSHPEISAVGADPFENYWTQQAIAAG